MVLRVDYIGSCSKLPRSPFKILYSCCQLSGVLLIDGWVIPQKLSSGEESCLVKIFSPSIGADCIQWLICMEIKMPSLLHNSGHFWIFQHLNTLWHQLKLCCNYIEFNFSLCPKWPPPVSPDTTLQKIFCTQSSISEIVSWGTWHKKMDLGK